MIINLEGTDFWINDFPRRWIDLRDFTIEAVLEDPTIQSQFNGERSIVRGAWNIPLRSVFDGSQESEESEGLTHTIRFLVDDSRFISAEDAGRRTRGFEQAVNDVRELCVRFQIHDNAAIQELLREDGFPLDDFRLSEILNLQLDSLGGNPQFRGVQGLRNKFTIQIRPNPSEASVE